MDSSNDTYREDRTSSKYSKAPMSPSSPNDNLQHYDDDDQDSSQESYFFGGHRRTHSGRRHSFTEGATSSQYSLGLEDLLNRQQSAAEVLEAFNAGSGNRMAEEDGYTAADYAAYAAASAASTRRYGNLSDGYGDFNPAAFNNHMHRSMLASGGMDPASQHAFLAAMSGAAFPGYPMPASSPFMASPTGMASAARLDGNRRNRRIPRAQSMTNLAAAAAAGGSPFFGMASPAFPNFRPHHPHLPNSPISPNMPGAHPYMFSEQQMFEAMSHSHAFSPLSSYYLNAAAAAAQASNAAQFRAAAAAASANPSATKGSSSKPSVSTSSSRPDDPRFSDSDVKLLKAAERIAKAQSSSLNNVQSEAEAASIRDRHRQALAEAALYTQSQQAAAAITAAAYATLSPSSSTPGRRSSSQGRGETLGGRISPSMSQGRVQRRPMSPSPTRMESSSEAAGNGGIGAGVVGMMGRTRRGSLRVQRRPSLASLDVAAANRIHSGGSGSGLPDSPAGLWAEPSTPFFSAGEEGGHGTGSPENSAEGSCGEEIEERVGRFATGRPRIVGRRGGSTTGMESDEPTSASASNPAPAPPVQKRRRSGASSATMGALTANGRYECQWPNCAKTFSTSGHLSRHARIHLGFKPFECDYPGCDARFSRSDNLRMHRKTHDKDKSSDVPSTPINAVRIDDIEFDDELISGGSRCASPVDDEEPQMHHPSQHVPAAYPSPINTPAMKSSARMGRKAVASKNQQQKNELEVQQQEQAEQAQQVHMQFLQQLHPMAAYLQQAHAHGFFLPNSTMPASANAAMASMNPSMALELQLMEDAMGGTDGATTSTFDFGGIGSAMAAVDFDEFLKDATETAPTTSRDACDDDDARQWLSGDAEDEEQEGEEDVDSIDGGRRDDDGRMIMSVDETPLAPPMAAPTPMSAFRKGSGFLRFGGGGASAKNVSSPGAAQNLGEFGLRMDADDAEVKSRSWF